MQNYHQSSVIRIQAIRLFYLIQQCSLNSQTVVNAELLSKFVNFIGIDSRQDFVKFMHKLDQQDKEMKQQYWGQCMSKQLCNFQVACDRDYLQVHRVIKSVIGGFFVDELEVFEKWDGNHLKDLGEKDVLYVKILRNCATFVKHIEFSTFHLNISNINQCFSLITLFPQKKQEILQIYQTILSGNFLQILQLGLSTNVSIQILIQILKSLCYLYQAMKYERIQKILSNTFLVNIDILKGLILNVKDTRPEVRYYNCALAALMSHNVKSFQNSLWSDKQFLFQVSNSINIVPENQGLIFGIQFFICVIKAFAKCTLNEQRENQKFIRSYLTFAINKLWELKSEQTQAVCMKLVVEYIKVSDFHEEDAKMLKFLGYIFEGTAGQKFQKLYQNALNIIKIALAFQRKCVLNYVIGEKSFENYMQKILTHHQQWEPYYSVLQILLMLARSQKASVLFQREIIPNILKLSKSQYPIDQFYLSEILLSLILNSLQSEWKITYLYEKQCMKAISDLIQKYPQKDNILADQYKVQSEISYANYHVYINAIKCLYYLNFQGEGFLNKKKELYVKNFTIFFINSFNEGLNAFFHLLQNSKFFLQLLRKQHHLSINRVNERDTIKMHTILHKVIQQMTYILRKRNTTLQILKMVNKTRSISLLIQNNFTKVYIFR